MDDREQKAIEQEIANKIITIINLVKIIGLIFNISLYIIKNKSIKAIKESHNGVMTGKIIHNKIALKRYLFILLFNNFLSKNNPPKT